MRRRHLVALVAVAGVATAYLAFDLGRFASLDVLKAQQAAVAGAFAAQPVRIAAVFFAAYVAVTALSLPGAAVMTLAGGAIFGFGLGLVLVSFASTIGATLAFLASRFVLRDAVQARFGERLAAVNAGIGKDGAFYLFTLRLVPVFPFFVVNLVMGLTPIGTWTFTWVSQLGMLLGTAVYVNAGTELARIDSPSDVLSPGLLVSFALLGVAPLIGKQIVERLRARRVYAPWARTRPDRFDRNLVVIGAGSAGLVSAYIAAAVRAKVTLVERHRLGGDCLYTGCVPSKALIRSAKLLAQMARASDLGIRSATAEFDFAEVMERVQRVVTTIEPHDSVARYTGLGVEVLQGDARITSPWTVEVALADGAIRTLTTRTIVIAAGARPIVPSIPGLAEVHPLTSDTVWALRRLPRRLVVLGGGPIGCELAQAFARFGATVTQVEMGPRLLPREDPEFSALVRQRFAADGVEVLVEHTAVGVEVAGGEKQLVVEHAGTTRRIPFDAILCAVGRVANTAGYGLEEMGIAITEARTVAVNGFMATRFPNIFACGDVAGPYQFTHTAAHGAWFASVNALFGGFKRFTVDYSVVPWTTFTDPEVAHVGLNEQEARARGIPCAVSTYGLDDLDRAIADGEAHGLVKVLTRPGTDRILGVTIAAAHAGEILIEFVTAMKFKLGLNKILGTIHTYPTFSEANKYAAGVWKRSTVTRGQHTFLEAFHAWTRRQGSAGAVLGALWPLWRDKRSVEKGAGSG